MVRSLERIRIRLGLDGKVSSICVSFAMWVVLRGCASLETSVHSCLVLRRLFFVDGGSIN
jgi:hypothetical protein